MTSLLPWHVGRLGLNTMCTHSHGTSQAAPGQEDEGGTLQLLSYFHAAHGDAGGISMWVALGLLTRAPILSCLPINKYGHRHKASLDHLVPGNFCPLSAFMVLGNASAFLTLCCFLMRALSLPSKVKFAIPVDSKHGWMSSFRASSTLQALSWLRA